MGTAVDRAVQPRLDALAADAVDEALTDDVLADLAAAARAGASEVVSPDRTPQLYYASLPDFVEGFLAGVYARIINTKGNHLVPRLVEAHRSRRPPRCPVAGLGTPLP